jgi:hypothetical protein
VKTAAIVMVMVMAAGCASFGREGLDPATLPPELRDDYAVFARRCSKCHPLARALQSGIDRDSHWVAYVTRMRRQPGSGIAAADVEPILRFLRYHTAVVRERRERAQASAGPPAGREAE